MTTITTHDADTDAIVAELEKAGLIEVYINEEGKEAYRLTEQGERVGTALAMAGDDGAAMVLDALLDGTQPDTT